MKSIQLTLPLENTNRIIRMNEQSRIEFSGNKLSNGGVSTYQPIPKTCQSYYFGIKVLSNGKNGEIGIGLTASDVNTTNSMPGWDMDSVGFISFVGVIYHNGFYEIAESYSTGDIVGCYFCRVNKNGFDYAVVQFTKNGKLLQSPRLMRNKDYYPTIGFRSSDAVVQTTFDVSEISGEIKGKIVRRNIYGKSNK